MVKLGTRVAARHAKEPPTVKQRKDDEPRVQNRGGATYAKDNRWSGLWVKDLRRQEAGDIGRKNDRHTNALSDKISDVAADCGEGENR